MLGTHNKHLGVGMLVIHYKRLGLVCWVLITSTLVWCVGYSLQAPWCGVLDIHYKHLGLVMLVIHYKHLGVVCWVLITSTLLWCVGYSLYSNGKNFQDNFQMSNFFLDGDNLHEILNPAFLEELKKYPSVCHLQN